MKKMSTITCLTIGVLFAVMVLTRSCFYSPNQMWLRQTWKLIDKEKSTSYYYGYGIFSGNRYYWSNTWWGDAPKKLKYVDRKTLVILSQNFAKDKNRVYYNSFRNTNVDVPTFEVVYNGKFYFLKDKNYVYSINSLIFLHEDSMENDVFKIVKDADPNSYIQIDDGWGKDKNHVFYYHKIFDADPKTFMKISDCFYRDRDFLYYDIYLENGKDRCNTGELTLVNERYIRTNTKIYYLDGNTKKLYSIPLKDTASIVTMSQLRWLKVDGKAVIKGHWLDDPNVDDETFAEISYNYYKDAKNIYFWKWDADGLTVLKDADRKTFEKINGYYAKDKKHVFCESEIVPDASPDDFYVDKDTDFRGYSGNNVYEFGKKVVKKKKR